MAEFNYGETFELMQAYSKLGVREQKIIEHLMTIQVYEGTYSELARELNVECTNIRRCLIYLDSIGIVYIAKKENNFGMKACFLVDGWMDILLKQYRENHIHSSDKKKKEIVDYYKKIEEEQQEKEREIAETKHREQIVEVMNSCFNKDISIVEVERMLEKLDIKIKE